MIKEFQNEYRWLSNFWPATIRYEGFVYPNVENAFHALKNESIHWKNYCATEENPRTIKKACHKLIDLRSDWEEVKVGILKDLIAIKFAQEPFRSQFLATGDQEIQEGNTWGDVFWGVDLETGEGHNIFREMIMELRGKIST